MLIRFSRRFGPWWLASLVALLLVVWLAPQQVSVLIYKLLQITIAVKAAYWADRALFRHAPPIDDTMLADPLHAARLLARAIVAFAVIVGITLGI